MVGPVRLNPGPIFPIHDIDVVKLVIKSYPFMDSNNAPANIMVK